MGHPQLLHVRISTLAEQSFPYPEARDLLGPTAEMDRVRVEARRLISALPDEARELLYRASLLTGRMQRQRLDRQRVVWGKSGSVSVDCGGRRLIKKKKTDTR